MATVDRQDKSAISSEASSLLDCFVEGLDEVVYEIAEEIARDRLGRTSDAPIRIVAEDVKKAGKDILAYLRHLVAKGKAPVDLSELLDSMERCLLSK